MEWRQPKRLCINHPFLSVLTCFFYQKGSELIEFLHRQTVDQHDAVRKKLFELYLNN